MLEVILTQYPDINVVLTLGSHGIWFANKSQKVFQDIYLVPVVDTTAAGDTFMGYYVASILIGKTEKEALALYCKLNDECFSFFCYEPDSKMLSIFSRCADHVAPDDFCRRG